MERAGQWLIVAALLAGCLRPPLGEAGIPSQIAAVLWPEPYRKVILEIDYIPHEAPSASAVAALRAIAAEMTRKEVIIAGPDPIEPPPGPSSRNWTWEELDALHKSTFDTAANYSDWGIGDAAFLHFLYLDGNYFSDDSFVWGYAADAAYIFKEAIDEFVAGVDQPNAASLERNVLLHEFGHLIGLVNCGTPMLTPRQIAGCHSTHEDSVMHHMVDRVDVTLDILQEGRWVARSFNDADLKDIRSYQDLGRKMHEDATKAR